jgi:cysteinyl-tRNA synthetase
MKQYFSMLTLYNSLTKKLEEVRQDETINLYSCGPTVYNYAHIGNLRSFICADVLYRTLSADGYTVKWVMNITDIDDKTIKATIAEHGQAATPEHLHTVTERYYQDFLQDLTKVGVSVDAISFVRVTSVMDTIKDFIKQLIADGFAYKTEDGSTYFSIQKYQEKFGDYGALMGEKFMDGKKINARIVNDEYHKDDLSDFALWKAHTPEDAQIFWDDPVLGRGRPGWHIECSAVNWEKFAGVTTTIHTGGVDLRFPHHTNEIAQSTPRYSPQPFTKHWFHSEHLLVDGKKMSKSLGNFYTMRDLEEKGFSGLDFRYFVLDAHYQKQQNFNFQILGQARAARNLLYQKAEENTSITTPQIKDAQGKYTVEHVAEETSYEAIKKSFLQDLDTHQALTNLQALTRSGTKIDQAELYELDTFFGLAIEQGVAQHRLNEEKIITDSQAQKLVDARNTARAAKNWPESDRLRKELENLGYTVEDTKEGTKIHKK